MTDKAPEELSDRAMITIDHLRNNQMAWILFWFVLGCTAISFLMLVVAVWSQAEWWMRGGTMGLTGIFGSCLGRITWYLFPTKPKA